MLPFKQAKPRQCLPLVPLTPLSLLTTNGVHSRIDATSPADSQSGGAAWCNTRRRRRRRTSGSGSTGRRSTCPETPRPVRRVQDTRRKENTMQPPSQRYTPAHRTVGANVHADDQLDCGGGSRCSLYRGLPYSVDGYEYGCGGRSFMPAPFSNTGPALSRWALGTSWTQARRERLVDIGISVQPSGHPWFPGSQDGNKKLNRAGHSRT